MDVKDCIWRRGRFTSVKLKTPRRSTQGTYKQITKAKQSTSNVNKTLWSFHFVYTYIHSFFHSLLSRSLFILFIFRSIYFNFSHFRKFFPPLLWDFLLIERLVVHFHIRVHGLALFLIHIPTIIVIRRWTYDKKK